MSTFGASVFGAVLLQTEPNVDPNTVRPGWTALLVTVLLLVALALLFVSMRKQLRKIHVPDDDRRAAEDAANPDGGTEPAPESQPEQGTRRGTRAEQGTSRPDPR